MDDEPKDEILHATYRALCKHGYAELTLQDIAAESDKSKASIHYYYDTKEDLFTAFLEYLFERYTEQVDAITAETPRANLLSLLDALLIDDEDTPDTEFQTAMLEMKAQAPYDDVVQAKFSEFDERLFEHIREMIAAGVEAGEFDESVDPDLAAEFIATTIQGARTRHVTVGHSMDRFRETVRRYVRTHLTDDAAEVTH